MLQTGWAMVPIWRQIFRKECLFIITRQCNLNRSIANVATTNSYTYRYVLICVMFLNFPSMFVYRSFSFTFLSKWLLDLINLCKKRLLYSLGLFKYDLRPKEGVLGCHGNVMSYFLLQWARKKMTINRKKIFFTIEG